MTPKEAKSLLPIPVAGLQCPVCKTVYLDVEKANACTKECAWKAYLKDLANRKELKRQEGMDWVRNNATSPEHAIKLLIQYCKSLNITLKINQYPDEFTDVSNSHHAPIGNFPMNWRQDTDKGIPTSYPGWHGRWEGTIRGKCPNKGCYSQEIDLNCLFECIVNGFRSGTGNPSHNFSISGSFFIYDFPKMNTVGALTNIFLKEPFLFSNSSKNLGAIELATKVAPLFEKAMAQDEKKPFDVKIRPYIQRKFPF